MSATTARRLANLRQKLTEVDGLLVSRPENMYYLSRVDGLEGYLLVTQKEAIVATDFRYVEQTRTQAPEYTIVQIIGSSLDWFVKMVGDLKLARLGFESDHMSVATHHRLVEVLGKAEVKTSLVPINGTVESLRIVKDLEEMELIARAATISDRAFEHISSVIHTGMTELEAAWEIEKFMRENGSQSLPFEAIVASGPNAALPHARPSERKIGPGEPIVIDIGARCGGYASDFTRTLCLEKQDTSFRKVYDTVLGAQLAALALIKEGMTGQEADRLARTVIEEAGYKDAFGHSLGHGVGLVIHESPRVGPNSTDVLNAGMVFSVEPGIYLPGWGGVRIEDLAILEKGGLRTLSKGKK